MIEMKLPSNDVLKELLKGSQIPSLAEKPDISIIPTNFVGFNRATRVGGVPLSCVMLVYGPSKGGKTAFVLGLVKTFQQLGHSALYIDAEHTLDKNWAQACNVDLSLPYERPITYQIARTKIHKVLDNFMTGKDKNKFPSDHALIIIVDSLNKLVPEQEAKKKDLDKAFPLRALFNTIWLDQITPIIHKYPILLVLIAHEKQKIDAEKWEDSKKIKGGSAIYYDSSLVVRIYSRKPIRQASLHSSEKVEVGILHEGYVEKNKLGICHEKFNFIMSTGRGSTPIGFDLVREVMEEAKLRGINSPLVRKSGGIWHCQDFCDGPIKGDPKLRAYLRQEPEILQIIVDKLNESALGIVSTDGEDLDE